ncbi:MAG: type II secretion system protein GspG [Pyrinomonadaceae bacterium]
MSRRTRLMALTCAVMTICFLLAFNYAQAAADLSASEARRLIARMAGIELPSNAVRVREVSSVGSSAVVTAQVETAFRFNRGADGKWRVAEVRTGDNRWEDVDMIARAVNGEKTERARAELETIGTALEAFRRERGFYVAADTSSALVDQLNPRYLARVIRVDPWHRPYRYEGTNDRFTLRSGGVDGEVNTPDDVVLSNR